MNKTNYTTKTYSVSTKQQDAFSEAFRIFNYEKLTKQLQEIGRIEKDSEVLDTCLQCKPGLIKKIIDSSIKINNSSGKGIELIKRFKTKDQTPYMHVREYLESNYQLNPILYGCARGNKAVLQLKEYFGEDYLYIDHAYFAKGHENANYRICVSSRHAGEAKEVSWDRKNYFLGIEGKQELKPWRKSGSHIALFPSSDNELLTRGSKGWVDETIAKIRKYTDREIIVQKKGEINKEVLKNAWAAVSDRSTAAMQILREGIPLFTPGKEVFSYAGNVGFEDMEHPLMGDREFLFNWLGYNQFTLKEMHSGLAIEILADIYG